MRPARTPRQKPAYGFTLIELMIVVAILAIIAAIAIPNYSAYVQRSRVPVALDALQAHYARMEQRFQDTGSYANGDACAVAPAATAGAFSLSCTIGNSGRSFTTTATGSAAMNGYGYSINHNGVRATTAHPKGTPAQSCWSVKGSTCDT
jgi:type IV pilus assembly protein PilE